LSAGNQSRIENNFIFAIVLNAKIGEKLHVVLADTVVVLPPKNKDQKSPNLVLTTSPKDLKSVMILSSQKPPDFNPEQRANARFMDSNFSGAISDLNKLAPGTALMYRAVAEVSSGKLPQFHVNLNLIFFLVC